MNVPPYIPLPIEIPGNVATKRFREIVGFVRRVVIMHTVSAFVVAAIAFTKPVALPAFTAWGVALGLLIALSLTRTICRGNPYEQTLSLILLPVLLVALGQALAASHEAGWPVWSPGLGLAGALMYTLFCGRDLSFVGMFGLSLVGSTAAIVAMGWSAGMPSGAIWTACSINTTYLSYFVYDLGALLSRRRLGEEWGAVVDLYRDALNFAGYSLRVVRHWQEHRIWSK